MADIISEMQRVPRFDVEKGVELVESKGLIFQEGGRYLSLVLPQEPPPMTHRTLQS